jgi:arylsulfatase
MSVAWSWAFDTPFKWTKQVASFFGGTRQGMVMSWPGHVKDVGGIRTQFHHIIDVVPTILEAAGVQPPSTVNGIAQSPIEGVSMVYTWDKAGAAAKSTRQTQYFEMFGNRAIYNDGWVACTPPPQPPWLMGTAEMPDLGAYKWELYNIADDYSQNNDPRGQEPRQAEGTAEALHGGSGEVPGSPAGQLHPAAADHAAPQFDGGTVRVHVFDRDVRPAGRQRPQHHREVILHCRGGRDSPGRRRGDAQHARGPLRRLRPVPGEGQARVHLQHARAGAVPLGGKDAIGPGKHTITFAFKYDGPGLAKGGDGTLSVDGKEVDKKTIPHTIPALMTIDESFDVGVDTRTGVDEKDYQPPFRFTGKLVKLTIKLEDPKRAAADQNALDRAIQQARNAAE